MNKKKLEQLFNKFATPEEKLALKLKKAGDKNKDSEKKLVVEKTKVRDVENDFSYELIKTQDKLGELQSKLEELENKPEVEIPEIPDPLTGEQIVEKINSLAIEPEKQIDFEHIKNFPWHEIKKGNDLISWGGTTLQTGGVANDSQTILNLTAGTGITITDGGSGLVTIASTVTSVWGGITGTLSDQTDLQTALDAKATTELDNLGTTAINADLIFDTDSTYDIGTTTASLDNIYTDTLIVTNIGATLADNSPFVFETAADTKNGATTALYIYPRDSTAHRLFWGKSGKTIYEMDLSQVQSWSGIPQFQSQLSLSVTNPAQASFGMANHLTGSNTQPCINFDSTWNTTGQARLIDSAITNTASHATSFFLRFMESSNQRFLMYVDGRMGINTTSRDKQFEINSATGDCLRLTYNDADGSAANYTDLAVSSSGDLTITPSGGDATFTGNLIATTAFLPDANDGASLGVSGTAFADAFLASGAVINFNAGDVTLTHSANKLAIDGGTFHSDYASLSAFTHTFPTGKTLTMGAGSTGAVIQSNGFLRFQSASATAVEFTDGTYTLTFTVEQFANIYRSYAENASGTRAFVLRHNPGLTDAGAKIFALDNVFAEVFFVNKDGLIGRATTAGITASTTQTQGQGALTKEVNEVSTVANANDTVTLPTAVAGYRIVIINNGANTLQIFPASGDNLGAGVDTATTLASGANVMYQAYNATNWVVI